MSFERIFRVFWKDVRLGPRSPVFLFVIVMPAVLTVIVQLIFGSKPNDACCDYLKSNGFRWSGRNGAWQRHLNNQGIYAADRAVAWVAANGWE